MGGMFRRYATPSTIRARATTPIQKDVLLYEVTSQTTEQNTTHVVPSTAASPRHSDVPLIRSRALHATYLVFDV